ncbi:MAG: hypothetical protein ACD_46C00106G0003 [uncultured bacterium]|nr:MAG: hypothetical protein ACD_46C00106G0003 [uncultured bacterium]
MLARKNYTDDINQLRSENITDPAEILTNLLKKYHAPDNSGLTQYSLLAKKRKIEHIELVNRLIKLRDYPSAENYIIRVIKHLKSYSQELNPNDELTKLLINYFSIYEHYRIYFNDALDKTLPLESIWESISSNHIQFLLNKRQSYSKGIAFVNIIHIPNANKKKITEELLSVMKLSDLSFYERAFTRWKNHIPSSYRAQTVEIILQQIEKHANACARELFIKSLDEISDWIPNDKHDEVVKILINRLNAKLEGCAAISILSKCKNWLSEENKLQVANALFANLFNDEMIMSPISIKTGLENIKKYLPEEKRPDVITHLLTLIDSRNTNENTDHATRRLNAYIAIPHLKDWMTVDERKQLIDKLFRNLTDCGDSIETIPHICDTLSEFVDELSQQQSITMGEKYIELLYGCFAYAESSFFNRIIFLLKSMQPKLGTCIYQKIIQYFFNHLDNYLYIYYQENKNWQAHQALAITCHREGLVLGALLAVDIISESETKELAARFFDKWMAVADNLKFMLSKTMGVLTPFLSENKQRQLNQLIISMLSTNENMALSLLYSSSLFRHVLYIDTKDAFKLATKVMHQYIIKAEDDNKIITGVELNSFDLLLQYLTTEQKLQLLLALQPLTSKLEEKSNTTLNRIVLFNHIYHSYHDDITKELLKAETHKYQIDLPQEVSEKIIRFA